MSHGRTERKNNAVLLIACAPLASKRFPSSRPSCFPFLALLVCLFSSVTLCPCLFLPVLGCFFLMLAGLGWAGWLAWLVSSFSMLVAVISQQQWHMEPPRPHTYEEMIFMFFLLDRYLVISRFYLCYFCESFEFSLVHLSYYFLLVYVLSSASICFHLRSLFQRTFRSMTSFLLCLSSPSGSWSSSARF